MTLETVLVVAAALAMIVLFARANRTKNESAPRTRYPDVPSGSGGGDAGEQTKPDGVGKPEIPNET